MHVATRDKDRKTSRLAWFHKKRPLERARDGVAAVHQAAEGVLCTVQRGRHTLISGSRERERPRPMPRSTALSVPSLDDERRPTISITTKGLRVDTTGLVKSIIPTTLTGFQRAHHLLSLSIALLGCYLWRFVSYLRRDEDWVVMSFVLFCGVVMHVTGCYYAEIDTHNVGLAFGAAVFVVFWLCNIGFGLGIMSGVGLVLVSGSPAEHLYEHSADEVIRLCDEMDARTKRKSDAILMQELREDRQDRRGRKKGKARKEARQAEALTRQYK